MIIWIVWVVLSYLIANAGDKKAIGFWGAFFLSLILSPLIGLIVVLMSGNPKIVCKYCSFKYDSTIYYCPRCAKDINGFTLEENKVRFKDSNASEKNLNDLMKPRKNGAGTVILIIAVVVVLFIFLQMMLGK